MGKVIAFLFGLGLIIGAFQGNYNLGTRIGVSLLGAAIIAIVINSKIPKKQNSPNEPVPRKKQVVYDDEDEDCITVVYNDGGERVEQVLTVEGAEFDGDDILIDVVHDEIINGRDGAHGFSIMLSDIISVSKNGKEIDYKKYFTKLAENSEH